MGHNIKSVLFATIVILGINSLASPRFNEMIANSSSLSQGADATTSEENLEIDFDFDEKSDELFEDFSDDTFEEAIEDESQEESEDESQEESEDESEKEFEDPYEEESQEVFEDESEKEFEDESNVLDYSSDDLFKFEATMYCEGGAQGTSYEIQVANAWIARNKIEQAIEAGSSDPFREALNPYHYQGVYDNEEGWYAKSPEGIVDQELIDSNPQIHEICVGVLDGSIPSPIYDWDCCICTKTYDFYEVVDIANSLGLVNYFVIENGIYFPSSEWTEEVNQFLMDF